MNNKEKIVFKNKDDKTPKFFFFFFFFNFYNTFGPEKGGKKDGT